MTGIELIAKERREQIEKHEITVKLDQDHNDFEELRIGARALLTNSSEQGQDYDFPASWNKTVIRKMCEKPYKERLIIAGALIAAEIDRINN